VLGRQKKVASHTSTLATFCAIERSSMTFPQLAHSQSAKELKYSEALWPQIKGWRAGVDRETSTAYPETKPPGHIYKHGPGCFVFVLIHLLRPVSFSAIFNASLLSCEATTNIKIPRMILSCNHHLLCGCKVACLDGVEVDAACYRST